MTDVQERSRRAARKLSSSLSLLILLPEAARCESADAMVSHLPDINQELATAYACNHDRTCPRSRHCVVDDVFNFDFAPGSNCSCEPGALGLLGNTLRRRGCELCLHKTLFPANERDLWGGAALFGAITIAGAVGIGGGGLAVPIMVMVMNFHVKEAVPLSHVIVFGSALAQNAINIPRRHPLSSARPLVDAEVALLLMPCMLGGHSLGVLLGPALPSTWIESVAVVVLLFAAIKTLLAAHKAYRLEDEEAASAGPDVAARHAAAAQPSAVPSADARLLQSPSLPSETRWVGGGGGGSSEVCCTSTACGNSLPSKMPTEAPSSRGDALADGYYARPTSPRRRSEPSPTMQRLPPPPHLCRQHSGSATAFSATGPAAVSAAGRTTAGAAPAAAALAVPAPWAAALIVDMATSPTPAPYWASGEGAAAPLWGPPRPPMPSDDVRWVHTSSNGHHHHYHQAPAYAPVRAADPAKGGTPAAEPHDPPPSMPMPIDGGRIMLLILVWICFAADYRLADAANSACTHSGRCILPYVWAGSPVATILLHHPPPPFSTAERPLRRPRHQSTSAPCAASRSHPSPPPCTPLSLIGTRACASRCTSRSWPSSCRACASRCVCLGLEPGPLASAAALLPCCLHSCH